MNLNKQFIRVSEDGDFEVVKFLVDKEYDVHAFNDNALCLSAQYGHLKVVKYLVEECGADVHAHDEYTLRWAAWKGHLDVVKYVVEECGADVHARDDYALRKAAWNEHLKVVKYLKTYNVSQFTNRHIDKQKRIEKSNQVFKQIRALPGIGIDYLYAFEHFNHLKTIY